MADYSSVFSSSGPSFNPATFGGMDLSPSISYGAPSPSKPGFDWLAAGAAAQDLLGGAANLISGIQGNPVQPRMAGSALQEYMESKKEDTSLADLLKSLISKSASEFGSFDPKKSQPV